MKRRNREARARMRVIQEYRLDKPQQRALDWFCRETGLSYRTAYRAYQNHTTMSIASFSLTNPVITCCETKENGVFELEITGKPPTAPASVKDLLSLAAYPFDPVPCYSGGA